MTELNAQDRALLVQAAEADDVLAARRQCEEFLKRTAARVQLQREPNTPEELLGALIDGRRVENPDALFDRMVRVNGRKFTVFAVSEPEETAAAERLLHMLQNEKDTWVITGRQQYLCVSLGSGDPEPSGGVKNHLLRQHITSGVSRPYSSLRELRTAYKQAVITLKTAEILRRGIGTPVCYDDFLMIRLLDSVRKEVNLHDFWLPDVQTLQDYDKSHDSELCRTMLFYLTHSRNVANTARELNIHRNTVHYRINKSMELLHNLDFKNDYITFLLMMSLYIAEYDYYNDKLQSARSLLSGPDDIIE